jgi:hypothetical protein
MDGAGMRRYGVELTGSANELKYAVDALGDRIDTGASAAASDIASVMRGVRQNIGSASFRITMRWKDVSTHDDMPGALTRALAQDGVLLRRWLYKTDNQVSFFIQRDPV